MKKYFFLYIFFYIFNFFGNEKNLLYEKLIEKTLSLIDLTKKINFEVLNKDKKILLNFCLNFKIFFKYIDCETFLKIFDDFFNKKYDNFYLLLKEFESLKNKNEICSETDDLRLKEYSLILLILQSHLLEIMKSNLKSSISNIKIGVEILIFIFDISRISFSQIIDLIEKYHKELLSVFNKYGEFDEDEMENSSIFSSFLNLQKKKPWVAPIMFLFFIYGIYKWHSEKKIFKI